MALSSASRWHGICLIRFPWYLQCGMCEEYCFAPPARTIPFCHEERRCYFACIFSFTENEFFPSQIPKCFTRRPTQPFPRWVEQVAGNTVACQCPPRRKPWPRPGGCQAQGWTMLTFKNGGKRNLESKCFHNGLSLPLYRDTGQSSWEARNLSSLATLSWPQWDSWECRMPSASAHGVPAPVPSGGWCQLFQTLFTVSKKDCNDIAWI